jgi:hypothetical protein
MLEASGIETEFGDQWQRASLASDVCFRCFACDTLQAVRRNFDRMLRELPDCEGRAQNEERVKHCFEKAAAFLFRANQESIRGFELCIHKVIW